MTAVAKLDAMKRIAAFVAVREKMAGTDPEVITESNGVPLLMSDLRAALSPAELGGVEAVPLVQSSAPERIWLAVADDAYYADQPFPNGLEEVCWSSDAPLEVCVPYVRADLSTPRAAEAEWLPIESAPENVKVWLFDSDTDPQQYAAILTERDPGVGGFYWRPAEQLVADMLDYELNPTHWRPLPAQPALTPPSAKGEL